MEIKFVSGLADVIAAQTEISSVDGKRGVLRYRGYGIEDLADNSSFEEVCYLLLYGKLPTKAQLNGFKNKLKKEQKLSKPVQDFIKGSPKTSNPMDVLRTAVSIIGVYAKKETLVDSSVRLIAKVPIIITAFGRVIQNKKILQPKPKLSIAGNFLYMLNGKVSKLEEEIFDVCLILHAEHGMNASTFSARVAASTRTDIYSAITAAIATLKGPRHGGANEKVLEMVKEIKTEKNVESYIMKRLKKKVRIMGFGHRVYRIKDPRAYILEERSKELARKTKSNFYDILKKVEKIMEREVGHKGIWPNVDFFSGSVYNSLKIPPKLFTPIFALGRVPGWCAHLLEEYQPANRIMRPKAIYIGPKQRKYIPISKR